MMDSATAEALTPYVLGGALVLGIIVSIGVQGMKTYWADWMIEQVKAEAGFDLPRADSKRAQDQIVETMDYDTGTSARVLVKNGEFYLYREMVPDDKGKRAWRFAVEPVVLPSASEISAA